MATSLIQRMGFADRDLGSPVHDTILEWLDEVTKVSEWFGKIYKCPSWDVDSPSCGDKPERPPIEFLRTQWEEPIIQNDRIIGFVDLAAYYKAPMLVATWDRKWKIDWLELKMSFEVKTHLRSVGEVIRQIRFYQKSGHNITVVAPYDERAARIFKNQGIHYIAVPSSVLEAPVESNIATFPQRVEALARSQGLLSDE